MTPVFTLRRGLKRLFVLSFIPCLVVDPAFAKVVVFPTLSHESSISRAVFEQNAFVPAAALVLTPFSVAAKVMVDRSPEAQRSLIRLQAGQSSQEPGEPSESAAQWLEWVRDNGADWLTQHAIQWRDFVERALHWVVNEGPHWLNTTLHHWRDWVPLIPEYFRHRLVDVLLPMIPQITSTSMIMSGSIWIGLIGVTRIFSRLPFSATFKRLVTVGIEHRWTGSGIKLIVQLISGSGLTLDILLLFLQRHGFIDSATPIPSMGSYLFIVVPFWLGLDYVPSAWLGRLFNYPRMFLRALFFPLTYVVAGVQFVNSPALTADHFLLLQDYADAPDERWNFLQQRPTAETQRIQQIVRNSPRLLKGLYRGLESRNDGSVLYSIWALGVAGSSADIPALLNLMANPTPTIREAAWSAIERLGPTAEQVKEGFLKVLNVLDDGDPRLVLVIERLAALRDPALKPIFFKVLETEKSWIRTVARTAIDMLQLPREEILAAWLPLLRSSLAGVRAEAIDALSSLNEPRTVAPILKRLNDRSKAVRTSVQNAVTHFLQGGLLAGNEKRAVKASLRNFLSSNSNLAVRLAAWKTLRALHEAKHMEMETLVAAVWDTPLTLAGHALLYAIYPDPYAAHPFRELLAAIKRESETQPEAVRQELIVQNTNAISVYFKKIQDLPPAELAADIEVLISLIPIVHDNLPLCLRALSAVGLQVHDVQGLIQVLPLNNPLTRILRMMGESRDVIGGYRDVVKCLRNAGLFPRFYDFVVQLAARERRSAPAQLGGALDILRSYGRDVSGWTPADWDRFSVDVEAYFSHGFPLITPKLFAFFKEHQDEPATIDRLKSDLEQEVSAMGWGHFYGLSDAFKSRYRLKDSDEMGLTARFLSVANLTLGDYEVPYTEVRDALQEIGTDAWTRELPEAARQLYAFRGTRAQLVYESEKPEHVKALGARLASLPSASAAMPEPAALINEVVQKSPELAGRLVALCLAEKTDAVRSSLAQMPPGIADRRAWLSEWYTLFTDTIRIQSRRDVEEKVRETLTGANADLAQLEEWLTSVRFHFQSLSTQRALPEPDPDFIEAFKAGEDAPLEAMIKEKWLPLFPLAELKDAKAFRAFTDRAWGRLISRVQNKLGGKVSAGQETRLQKILEQARNSFVADEPAQLALRREQLVRRLTDGWMASLDPDIEAVEQELDYFREVTVASDEKLYVGFFDDLLHLAGEFMMTGVCTWRDRARQVTKGSGEGYHFGVLAIKNEAGQVLAFSQVQVLKTPLQDGQRDNNFHILSLTGLNLAEHNLPMGRREAVLTLLKAADLLAKRLSLDGAVLVKNPNIHSNQHDVKTIIQTLYREGLLQDGEMASEVVLSVDPEARFRYRKVYALHLPGEPILDEVSPPKIAALKPGVPAHPLAAPREELTFGDGFGRLVGFSADAGTRMKNSLEQVLGLMPSEAFQRARQRVAESRITIFVESAIGNEPTHVARENGNLILWLGRDVSASSAPSGLQLADPVAELVATLLIPEFKEMTERGRINENSWFKTALIKALLTFRLRLPLYYQTLHRGEPNVTAWDLLSRDDQEAIMGEMERNLGNFTRGQMNVFQWNIFLSVMDDADPAFLVNNYLHMLASDNAMADGPGAERLVMRLIETIGGLDVSSKVSIVRIRNVVKEFSGDGHATISILGSPVTKDKFAHFDDTLALSAWRETLLTTSDTNLFFQTMRAVLLYMLPLDSKSIVEEMSFLIEQEDLMRRPDRKAVIGQIIRDVLTRRLGSEALRALEDHLAAKRVGNIPMFQSIRYTLDPGQDADDEGVYYRTDEDWIPQLFILPTERGLSSGGGGVVWALVSWSLLMMGISRAASAPMVHGWKVLMPFAATFVLLPLIAHLSVIVSRRLRFPALQQKVLRAA